MAGLRRRDATWCASPDPGWFGPGARARVCFCFVYISLYISLLFFFWPGSPPCVHGGGGLSATRLGGGCHGFRAALLSNPVQALPLPGPVYVPFLLFSLCVCMYACIYCVYICMHVCMYMYMFPFPSYSYFRVLARLHVNLWSYLSRSVVSTV